MSKELAQTVVKDYSNRGRLSANKVVKLDLDDDLLARPGQRRKYAKQTEEKESSSKDSSKDSSAKSSTKSSTRSSKDSVRKSSPKDSSKDSVSMFSFSLGTIDPKNIATRSRTIDQASARGDIKTLRDYQRDLESGKTISYSKKALESALNNHHTEAVTWWIQLHNKHKNPLLLGETFVLEKE